MFEFLKRLTGRTSKSTSDEPSSEAPSWHPDRTPQQAQEQKGRQRFATLQPGTVPALKPEGSAAEEPKDKPAV